MKKLLAILPLLVLTTPVYANTDTTTTQPVETSIVNPAGVTPTTKDTTIDIHKKSEGKIDLSNAYREQIRTIKAQTLYVPDETVTSDVVKQTGEDGLEAIYTSATDRRVETIKAPIPHIILVPKGDARINVTVTPYPTHYINDDTVTLGDQRVEEPGVLGISYVDYTGETVILQDAISEIVAVHTDDPRYVKPKPMPEPSVTVNPFEKPSKPMPEPSVTVNPFDKPSTQPSTEPAIQPAQSTEPSTVQPSVKTVKPTTLTKLPETGEIKSVKSVVLTVIGLVLLLVTGVIVLIIDHDMSL